MSRIDLIVDGVKHRFVISTAASNSIFPEHLVPSGRLDQNANLRLATVSGSELDISGSYEAVLESPDVDFRISFRLTVAKGCRLVLGNDFLEKVMVSTIKCGSDGYCEVVNQRGASVRLPLTKQTGPDEDGIVLVPGLVRLPQPSSSSQNGAQHKSKQKVFVAARNVVLFHFETTGFGSDAEIIQIAATCRGSTFNVYILPEGDIHPRAAEKNGFWKSGDWLFLRDQVVYVTPLYLAVDKFLAFLRGVGGNAVLAAHNAHPFHGPHLAKLLSDVGLSKQFKAQVRGLADTLPLFRKALQGRASAGKGFGLEDLAKDLLEEQVHVLDAQVTVAILERLIKVARIEYKEIIDCAKPFL